MVAVKKRKPATIQNTNESVRRSEVVEAEISSAESNAPVSRSWRQSRYLRNCESLYTVGRLGRCCPGLLLRFVVQCRFAYKAWPSAKTKTAKISSEESGRFSVKICTSENFPLYGIHDSKIATRCTHLPTD